MHILGLTTTHITQQDGQFAGKEAGLYNALHRRYGVAGVVQPRLTRADHYLNKLRHFHPDRERWRAQASVNPWAFRRRSRLAEQAIRAYDGRYDLVVQLYGLMKPALGTPRRPYVLTTDNTYRLSERYWPQWAALRGRMRDEWVALERQLFHGASFLFPWSEFTRRSLIDDYGVPPERVIAAGAGFNLDAPPLDGKRYDGQTALFVGYDFERKGGLVLLRAWEQVRRALPKAQLWIVGPKRRHGPDLPGVTWHGRIDRASVADLYARATLFVMPSLFEPWGHVFIEAMGYGLPCIGADCCAMPEMIADGSTGLLVPPREPEPLSEALIALLGDPAHAAAMGRRARAHVLHGQTWDDVVARMAPYLEQAVGVSDARAVAV